MKAALTTFDEARLMSISLAGSSQSDSRAQIFQQRRQALKSMTDAVQSGDMTTAQKSASVVKNDTGQILGTRQAPSLSPIRATIKNDLTALMQAVDSGDLTQSQVALAQLNTDKAAARPAAPPSAPASGANAFMNDLASLLSSLSAGDSTGAKTAATALKADLQTFSATSALAQLGHLGAGTTPDSDGDGDGDGDGDQSSNSAPTHEQSAKLLTNTGSQNSDSHSGDDTQASQQIAAESAAADLANVVPSRRPQGTHHLHHAHAGQKSSAQSDGAPPASSADTVKNATDAYELLMSFAQPASGSAATQTITQTV
ncbi:MAG: hypothetical protein JWL62_2312 [Hyphomicrobiales bacterium]|nr:hypothetical protein [Hyphomicrobiales bacterium]